MALSYFKSPGAIVTDTPANLVMLTMTQASLATAQFSTLFGPGPAAYQVPVGKTLTIVGVSLSSTVAGNSLEDVGYGDTSVANSATRPTNPVYQNMRFLMAVEVYVMLPLAVQVPAQKYPFCSLAFTGVWSCAFYGYVA